MLIGWWKAGGGEERDTVSGDGVIDQGVHHNPFSRLTSLRGGRLPTGLGRGDGLHWGARSRGTRFLPLQWWRKLWFFLRRRGFRGGFKRQRFWSICISIGRISGDRVFCKRGGGTVHDGADGGASGGLRLLLDQFHFLDKKPGRFPYLSVCIAVHLWFITDLEFVVSPFVQNWESDLFLLIQRRTTDDYFFDSAEKISFFFEGAVENLTISSASSILPLSFLLFLDEEALESATWTQSLNFLLQFGVIKYLMVPL